MKRGPCLGPGVDLALWQQHQTAHTIDCNLLLLYTYYVLHCTPLVLLLSHHLPILGPLDKKCWYHHPHAGEMFNISLLSHLSSLSYPTSAPHSKHKPTTKGTRVPLYPKASKQEGTSTYNQQQSLHSSKAVIMPASYFIDPMLLYETSKYVTRDPDTPVRFVQVFQSLPFLEPLYTEFE